MRWSSEGGAKRLGDLGEMVRYAITDNGTDAIAYRVVWREAMWGWCLFIAMGDVAKGSV